MIDMELLIKLFDKLEAKVDTLHNKIDHLDDKVIENSVVLAEHQRRSLANEHIVELLREEIKPLQKHVIIINGLLKILGFVAMLLGAAEAIATILHP